MYLIRLIAVVSVSWLLACVVLYAQSWRLAFEDGRQWGRFIDCADSAHCMAVSSDGPGLRTFVMATTDGGLTWTQVYEEEPLNDVRRHPLFHFGFRYVTPDLAIIAADSGIIIRTTDGGKTWREQLVDSTRPYEINAIDMCDESNGVLVLDGGPTFPALPADLIYRTTDGGATWFSTSGQPHVGLGDSSAAFLNAIVCQSPEAILAPYMKGGRDSTHVMVRSTDGGKTWSNFGDPFADFPGISHPHFTFFSETEGMMTGWYTIPAQFALVAATSDGGETWQTIVAGKLNEVEGLGGPLSSSFWTPQQGIAGLDDAIARTTDGGRTWTRDGGAEDGLVREIWVAATGEKSGVAVTGGGALFYRKEGISGAADLADAQSNDLIVSRTGARARFSLTNRTIDAVETYDLLGNIRDVGYEIEASGETTRVTMSTEGLSAGSYFVRIHSKGRQDVLRIVLY